MIDLHTHSTASDGFLSPSELLHAAEKIGLEALALTDHDAVSGLDELHAAAAKNRKVEIVNGAELSVFYPGAEMEILALDIPEKSLPAFREYQQNELARRDQMAHRRIELLQNFGVDITYEEVALDKDGNPRTQIRRPHFTDVLLKKGYIQNTEEAYKVVFARGGIAFVENRPRRGDYRLHPQQRRRRGYGAPDTHQIQAGHSLQRRPRAATGRPERH